MNLLLIPLFALLPPDKQIELSEKYKEKRNNDLERAKQIMDEINKINETMKRS